MNEMIQSKALEVNLSNTNKVPYTIPDNHLWFLSLSEKYWGIHKRAQDFFNEYHHPFSNRKEVVNLLVNLSISDFWIYREIEEREKAMNILIDIFDHLLKEKLSDDLSKQVIFVFLDFINNNYESLAEFDCLPQKILTVLNDNFESNYFSYFCNIGHFKKKMIKLANNDKTEQATLDFMCNLIKRHITFWQETTHIEAWYEKNKDKMSKDYSKTISSLGKSFYDEYFQMFKDGKTWDDLCRIAFTFSDIIDAYKSKIDDFERTSEQFCYIFYLLHLPGVAYHREYLLIELNKVIKKISHELNEDQSIQSIDELFLQFKDFKESHLNLILDSILTLGKEIINTHNTNLIHYFENHVINFGFITPGIAYLTNDWELKVNPCHVKNIRVWLELIEYDPEMMKRLLFALIINLRIGGIFIFDTDFFQKDISKLLNSRISPIYKQVKQLARLFPVYFNEIGAEGVLRDVSTKVDEISHRNDKLIHFLRKQIHTEGNNSHIDITVQIIRYWYDLKKKNLKAIIPANVYETVENDGIWVKGVHEVLEQTCQVNQCSLEELIEKDKDELSKMVDKVNHENSSDKERVCLIVELYQLLKEKYIFETTDISAILHRYYFVENSDIELLEKYLNEKQNVPALKHIYSFMIKLNEIIFDSKVTEGWENVFYKRHIAFGIPSMYGYYKEEKFDALGLTFRLERIASVLVKDIISEINTDYFTLKTIKDICDVIELLKDGLKLDGIYDQSFDSNLKMLQYSLTSGCFTINQYINIFQFMEVNIKEITNAYFIRPYEQLLHTIIPQHLPQDKLLEKETLKKIIAQKSEVFYRESLSSSFIIQQLDNFIGEILSNLRRQINNLTNEEALNLMTYDQNLAISAIYSETPNIDNQVFLGNKAYYLKKLALNNYPVPRGFVVTTEVFRRMEAILKVPALNAEFDKMIKHYLSDLEAATGLEYGNPERPLLLSVRSGSAISMPGAMNTFLNVGLNDDITENLSKQHNFGWTSWDCYRRLLQTWGMSYGLDRDIFDSIIIGYKKQYNVAQKIEFTPQNMKEIAFAYKQLLIDNHIQFEEDPYLQLKAAIISVFNSWDTPRAKVYREHMHIANEWGTAVTVQKMILGNIHRESGSGVLFTRDVQDKESVLSLTGDFSFLSQGEDIVGGLVNTLPISERQRNKSYHKSPFSLESAFPEIFNRLKELTKQMIEKDGFGHQEIEFTFETAKAEDLFILQTRNMVVAKQNSIEVFDISKSKMNKVGSGIGIGNKVLNGVIVFDLTDIADIRKKMPEQKTVLIRPDTVPDDIEIIFECDGLLTGRGGATSHAAVTAATLGKTCVVNCNDMIVYENEKRCTINDVSFNLFDPIAIDGNNGIIYKGNYPIKTEEF